MDWVDPAHLYLHLQQPERRWGAPVLSGDCAELRRLGIRTATALEEAFRLDVNGAGEEPARMISPERNTQLVDGLRWHLNGNQAGNGASVTETIRTLGSASNLKHVRAWKRDWRRRGDAGTPESPAAVVTNGDRPTTPPQEVLQRPPPWSQAAVFPPPE